MGLFDIFKKKEAVSFEEIDFIEKAKRECEKSNLKRMHIISPIFGVSDDDDNILCLNIKIGVINESKKDSYSKSF